MPPPPPPPPPSRSPKLPRPVPRPTDKRVELRARSGGPNPKGPRVRSLSPCVTRKRLSATIATETKIGGGAKPPQRPSSPKQTRERAKRRGSVQVATTPRGRSGSVQPSATPRGRSGSVQPATTPRGRSGSVQPITTRGRSSSPAPARFNRQGSRTSLKEARPGSPKGSPKRASGSPKRGRAGSPKLEKTKRAASSENKLSTVTVKARSSSPTPTRAKAIQKRLSQGPKSSLLKKPSKIGLATGKNEAKTKKKKKKASKAESKKPAGSPKMSVMKKLQAAHGENAVKKKTGSPKMVAMKRSSGSETPNKISANRRFQDLPRGSMSRDKGTDIPKGSMSRPKNTDLRKGSMSRPRSLDMPRGSMSRPKDSVLPRGSMSRPKAPSRKLSCESASSDESSFYSDTVSVTSEDEDDDDAASSCVSCNSSSDESSLDRALRNVSFGSVDVQEFRYSIGTDVVTSIGPPVTLCRKPMRSLNVDLESFEQERAPVRRHVSDLRLSEDDRIHILQKHGFSVEEIELASWESETVRTQRFKSIKNKEWDGWAAASESFSRKIGKITSPQALFGF